MEIIFLSVLNMSLTASFIIAAIMLARLPLKKAPKIISYALWAVAGFRLVFPFTLESVFSLLPFKAAPIPQDIATQAVPRIDSGITIIDNAVSASLPAAVPYASVNPLQIWIFIGSCVWLFGAAVMLIYSFVSIILLKRGLRGAGLIEDKLYEAGNLKTPFVIGLLKPKIYIPAGLTGEERRYIILHEQTHIRRSDHIVKMLAYFILCIHWFNPLAWAAFILMGADMEMSCDERVMRELGGEIKSAYSLSLVRVAAGHKILNGSPLAFGEGGMKERIKNILNFKKRSRIIVVAAAALAVALSVGFAANRAADNTITENKLLEKLGYTKELILSVLDNRTIFSENNEHIDIIVKSLPLQADRKYASFSLAEGQEINIAYAFDLVDYPYNGGNGLDPFPETVRENNALLLFASVEGLKRVNFLHYDGSQTLDHTDSYTKGDLAGRFGEITPSSMSFVELYNSLAENIQMSEFYFAHYSRIYLGADFEEVSYRNGEPNEVIQQEDSSVIWIYSGLGESYRLLPSGDREIVRPGHTEVYYFNSPSAEKNDNLTGLYAAMSYESDGEHYDDLTAYFGYPGISKDIGNGIKYIAYPLREGQQRHAYFILNNNKVIAQGIMYGNDYAALELRDSSPISVANSVVPSPVKSEEPKTDPYSFETLDYPGSHALYALELTDGTRWTVVLSQPVRQGASGIWCVERMIDKHGNAYQTMPDTDMTAADYYTDQQRKADEGIGLGEGPYEGGFFLHAEATALRYLELNYESLRYDIASALLMLYPSYELKGNIIHQVTAEPNTIKFYEMEWLSREDTERLNSLDIDPQTLPNGFYVRETHAGIQLYGLGEDVTVSVIDWDNNGQTHKTISYNDFETLLGNENEYPRLWRLTFENGLVSEITEQYLP